jgi:hypothetical protein
MSTIGDVRDLEHALLEVEGVGWALSGQAMLASKGRASETKKRGGTERNESGGARE